MAYSRSPQTLDQRRPLLVSLERDEEHEWRVEPGTEIEFAQAIREALYIAALYPDYYPTLAQASARFKIIRPPKSVGVVRAVRKKHLTAVDMLTIDHAAQLATREITTAEQAKEAWRRVASTDLPRLEFPSLTLSSVDMLAFYEWASSSGLLLFAIPGGGTRVCRHAPELAPLAWDPSDMED